MSQLKVLRNAHGRLHCSVGLPLDCPHYFYRAGFTARAVIEQAVFSSGGRLINWGFPLGVGVQFSNTNRNRAPYISCAIISLGHASSSPEKGRSCSKRSFPCDLYGQLEKSKNLIHTEADMSVLSESNCNERLGIGTPEWDRVAHSSFQ